VGEGERKVATRRHKVPYRTLDPDTNLVQNFGNGLRLRVVGSPRPGRAAGCVPLLVFVLEADEQIQRVSLLSMKNRQLKVDENEGSGGRTEREGEERGMVGREARRKRTNVGWQRQLDCNQRVKDGRCDLINFRIRCWSPASGFGKMSAFQVASHTLRDTQLEPVRAKVWEAMAQQQPIERVQGVASHLSAFRFPPISMALTSSGVHLLIEIPLHLCWNSRCRPLHVMQTWPPPRRVNRKADTMRRQQRTPASSEWGSHQRVEGEADLARKLQATESFTHQTLGNTEMLLHQIASTCGAPSGRRGEHLARTHERDCLSNLPFLCSPHRRGSHPPWRRRAGARPASPAAWSPTLDLLPCPDPPGSEVTQACHKLLKGIGLA
jgi:hypothetical protein